jgi:hypothetical protein
MAFGLRAQTIERALLAGLVLGIIALQADNAFAQSASFQPLKPTKLREEIKAARAI